MRRLSDHWAGRAAICLLLGLGLLVTSATLREPVGPPYKWVLRITYVDDLWEYPDLGRCDIHRQSVESNQPVKLDMRRVVECRREPR